MNRVTELALRYKVGLITFVVLFLAGLAVPQLAGFPIFALVLACVGLAVVADSVTLSDHRDTTRGYLQRPHAEFEAIVAGQKTRRRSTLSTDPIDFGRLVEAKYGVVADVAETSSIPETDETVVGDPSVEVVEAVVEKDESIDDERLVS